MKKRGGELMRLSSKGRANYATVWMWGDDLEMVKVNVGKYVAKRWREKTKECVIGITAKERDEGTIFYLSAYLSEPKKAGDLAERLLDTALNLKGDVKVYFVTILLSENVESEKESYRSSLERVEEEYERIRQILTDKFSADPRVRAKAEGKKITVVPEVSLRCELSSECAKKVVVDAVDFNFQRLKGFVRSMGRELINEGFARRIVGYELSGDIKELDIGSVEVYEDEVYVMLATPLSKDLS